MKKKIPICLSLPNIDQRHKTHAKYLLHRQSVSTERMETMPREF